MVCVCYVVGYVGVYGVYVSGYGREVTPLGVPVLCGSDSGVVVCLWQVVRTTRLCGMCDVCVCVCVHRWW